MYRNLTLKNQRSGQNQKE